MVAGMSAEGSPKRKAMRRTEQTRRMWTRGSDVSMRFSAKGVRLGKVWCVC